MTAAVLRGKIAGLAMLAALSAGAPALSQDADQLWGWCFGDAPDDRTIQGCDAVIAASRGSQKQQAGAFYNRGVARRNKGQLDLALQDYGQAIKLAPTDADIFYNRGVVLQSLGRVDAAIADYDTAIGLKPNFAMAFNNRGVLRRLQGQYDRALQDYDQAVRIDPRHAAAFNNRCALRAI